MSESRLPTISFVVCAYNEEFNIGGTVEQIQAAMGSSDWRFSGYEILLVNDASTDGTGRRADELAYQHPNVRAFHNPINLGMGGAYKRGLTEVRMDYVMILGAVNCIPAASIAMVLAAVGKADIILPYVTNDLNRPLIRRIGSAGFVMLLNLLFGQRIRYYNGAVVHRTALVRSLQLITNSAAIQAESVLKLVRIGHSYLEVGYANAPRPGGASKGLRLRNLGSALNTVWRLRMETLRGRRLTSQTKPVNK